MKEESMTKEIRGNANAVLKFVFCVPCIIIGTAIAGLPFWLFVIFYPSPTIQTYEPWLLLFVASVLITVFWFFIIALPILDRTVIKHLVETMG